MSSRPAHPVVARVVAFAIVLLPILVMLASIGRYGVNIPYWDDYPSILGWLNRYLASQSLTKHVALLWEQHNEHRLVFNRLIILACRQFFGVIDFRAFMYIGFSGLLGIFWVLRLNARQFMGNWWYFVPVSFLLFQPEYYHNLYWAMASLSNYFVIFWAMASLFVLARNFRYSLPLAATLATLASFTQGNGLLTFACGALILLVQGRRGTLGWWLGTMVAVAGIYFFNYATPSHHPALLESILAPVRLTRYFFNFLGSSLYPAGLAGVGIAGFFLWLTLGRYYRRNPALYASILFLMLSAAAAALSRSPLGVEQALTSRYRINSILLIILAYLSFVQLFDRSLEKRRGIAALFLAAAVGFNLVAWKMMLGPIAQFRSELVESHGLVWDDAQLEAERILLTARANGIYDFPLAYDRSTFLRPSNQQDIAGFRELRQTFVSPSSRLARIEIFRAAAGPITVPYTFSLRDQTCDTVLRSIPISAEATRGGFMPVVFEPIAVEPGRRYCFVLAEGAGMVLPLGQDDVYPEGETFVDGASKSRDVVFRLRY